MEEMGKNIKIELEQKKLEWDPPKLICLDKSKTEDGFSTGTHEDSTYSNPAS